MELIRRSSKRVVVCWSDRKYAREQSGGVALHSSGIIFSLQEAHEVALKEKISFAPLKFWAVPGRCS